MLTTSGAAATLPQPFDLENDGKLGGAARDYGA
jgi:hypothetical protein